MYHLIIMKVIHGIKSQETDLAQQDCRPSTMRYINFALALISVFPSLVAASYQITTITSITSQTQTLPIISESWLSSHPLYI